MATKALPEYKKGQTPEDYYKACIDAGWTDEELDEAFEGDIPESKEATTQLDVHDGKGMPE